MIVVAILKDKIVAAEISGGKKPQTKIIKELSWDKDNLSQILKQIKKAVGAKMRLLIDEDFARVFCLPQIENSEGEELTREKAKEAAGEIFPANFEDVLWEFGMTGNGAKQIVAMDKTFLDLLTKAVNDNTLRVTSMEPISCALARQIQNQTSVSIVLIDQINLYLVVVRAGTVITSNKIAEIPNLKDLKQLLKFVEKTFGLLPDKVIFSGDKTALDASSFEKENLPIEFTKLDFFQGLAEKKEFNDLTQEENQNLGLPRLFADEKTKTNPRAKKKTGRILPWKTIATVLILIIAVGFFATSSQKLAKNISFARPSPTPTPTSLPKPTPTISLKSYKIKVLNGSGVEGEAKKVVDQLKTAGFAEGETANADNFDYKETLIRTKQTVPQTVNLQVAKALEKKYTVKTGENLSASDSSDIQVIVGQAKTE